MGRYAMARAAWSRDGRLVGRTCLGRDLVDRKCPVLERIIQPCRRQREAEDHPPKGNTGLHSLSHACAQARSLEDGPSVVKTR